MPNTMYIADHSYGKSEVRVVKVIRDGARHSLVDLNVSVALRGDFTAAYERGDNAGMLSTDSMRNTIYAFAQQHALDSVEAFGLLLARHFLHAAPRVTSATIHITAYPWSRIVVGGQAHDHAFTREAGERSATITADARDMRVEAGIDNLLILKTTASGWAGFLEEPYTTLPPTDDRILATMLTARWLYAAQPSDYNAAWQSVRERILTTFTDHYSPSVQHTLYRMGSAVLAAHPEVTKVHFELPNKHHLRFNLEPFGLPNDNEVFHATNEPYGLITGTVERQQPGGQA
jgi:urate oxidase